MHAWAAGLFWPFPAQHPSSCFSALSFSPPLCSARLLVYFLVSLYNICAAFVHNLVCFQNLPSETVCVLLVHRAHAHAHTNAAWQPSLLSWCVELMISMSLRRRDENIGTSSFFATKLLLVSWLISQIRLLLVFASHYHFYIKKLTDYCKFRHAGDLRSVHWKLQLRDFNEGFIASHWEKNKKEVPIL